MDTQIYVNTGSGNGLLPDGTKPLPEPTLTFHSPESNFTASAQAIIRHNNFENHTLKKYYHISQGQIS